jgi:hypothetical protein
VTSDEQKTNQLFAYHFPPTTAFERQGRSDE